MAQKVLQNQFFHDKDAEKKTDEKNKCKKIWKIQEIMKNIEKKAALYGGTYIVISDNDRRAVYGCFSRNTTGTHFFEKRTTPKSLILRENPKISPVFYENPHRNTTTPKSRGFFPWTPIEWWRLGVRPWQAKHTPHCLLSNVVCPDCVEIHVGPRFDPWPRTASAIGRGPAESLPEFRNSLIMVGIPEFRILSRNSD